MKKKMLKIFNIKFEILVVLKKVKCSGVLDI